MRLSQRIVTLATGAIAGAAVISAAMVPPSPTPTALQTPPWVSRDCRVVARIPIGLPGIITPATGVAVDPPKRTVYLTDQVDLVVISGRTNKVIARVGVGLLPEGVGVNPRTNRIYVGNALSGSVSVVSGRTRKVVATVGVEPGPDTRIAVIRGPTPFTALWVAAGCG